jgi:hypothetical protein
LLTCTAPQWHGHLSQESFDEVVSRAEGWVRRAQEMEHLAQAAENAAAVQVAKNLALQACAGRFYLGMRSILTEIYLCRACCYQT